MRLLDPPAPTHVLNAASKLMFRDLVVVAVMVDRKRATDQTWIYIPEKKIPFGRIHEPTNWSEKMAPEGKTILVAEYFSFEGDRIWNASDGHLADITVMALSNWGLSGEARFWAVLLYGQNRHTLFLKSAMQSSASLFAII